MKRFVSLFRLLSYLLVSPRLVAPAHPWPLRGRVVFFSPELSGNNQVTLSRIQVPNPAALRVFTSAILHDGAASCLWKQTSERQFRWVLAGLQPGN